MANYNKLSSDLFSFFRNRLLLYILISSETVRFELIKREW